MNLMFETKVGHAKVEFPFQTPTYLTYDVLNESDLEKRIALIHAYIDYWYKDDVEYGNRLKEKCDALMRNDTLELSMI
jgi:hypothetical protein